MKQILFQTFLIAVLLFGLFSVALAVECPPGQICNPLNYNSFEDLVDAITTFVFNISLVVAPIMFVIAGIMFVTSAGDPEKAKTARQVALYTAIGFAVILAASGLIKVLQDLLKVKT